MIYATPEYLKDVASENKRCGYEWDKFLERPDWEHDVFEIHAITQRQINRIKARDQKHEEKQRQKAS